MERLDADAGQGVEVLKGPSRAVSVSFSSVYRGQPTHKPNRPRYLNGFPGVQTSWMSSCVWTVLVVALLSVPSATNLAHSGAEIASASTFVAKSVSSIATPSSPSTVLRCD
jgi:hypothetical protein